jgi:RES domain-containing protein
MRRSDRVHDRALLDSLDAINPIPFDGDVWRITRAGRDPMRGSTANGRWNPPGEFEVLYTSLEQSGALAEIGYRLSLEPVWPSKIVHEIHRLGVTGDRTLKLAHMVDLAGMGLDTAKYSSFEYQATQAVAAAAHFLNFDGLVAPSARHQSLNLVLFLENRDPSQRLMCAESHPVDWAAWRNAQS